MREKGGGEGRERREGEDIREGSERERRRRRGGGGV